MSQALQKTLEPVTVCIQPPPVIQLTVSEPKVLPVVTIQIPGIQGPAAADQPLDIDPLTTYLTARGAFPNGDNAEHPD